MNAIYDLYGLKVRVPFILPYSQSSNSTHPDLEIIKGNNFDFKKLPFRRDSMKDCFYYRPLKDGSIYLRWNSVSEFLISSDYSLVKWYSRRPSFSESFQNYVLNQVLSFALLAKKKQALHGAAVVIDKKALLLLGDSGYGKSTLASALMYFKNYALLTDDLVVFKEMSRSKGYSIYPGLRRIKLFPQSFMRFMSENKIQENFQMIRGSAKRIFLLDQKQCVQEVTPLKAIYLLPSPEQQRKTKKISINSISPREALFGLHSNMFNRAINNTERLKNEFIFCDKLLKSNIPIKSIVYPRGLGWLSEVCNTLLNEENKT